MKENTTGHRERFVRNLPVQGLPEDRDGAIIEAILQGKDGFLNYLRYLLGVMGSEDASGHLDGDADGAWNLGVAGLESRALLEGLTRTLARDPERLEPVRDLMDHLRESEKGREMLPDGFEALWAAFESVLPAVVKAKEDRP